jgi:hypothetical protein
MTKTSDLALGLSPELKSKVLDLVAYPLLFRRYRGVKMTTFTVRIRFIVNRLRYLAKIPPHQI